MVNIKRATIALFSIVACVFVVIAAEDQPLSVTFVNNSPDTSIELFWENHSLDVSHQDRRRIVASIRPRGGWFKVETFVGHGKYVEMLFSYMYNIPCFFSIYS